MRSLELAIERGGPYTKAIEMELEQMKQLGPRG